MVSPCACAPRSPPRTRGRAAWTSPSRAVGEVSSAHAWTSRSIVLLTHPCTGLLRARVDEPVGRLLPAPPVGSPPRTRGRARTVRAAAPARSVSSAHAWTSPYAALCHAVRPCVLGSCRVGRHTPVEHWCRIMLPLLCSLHANESPSRLARNLTRIAEPIAVLALLSATKSTTATHRLRERRPVPKSCQESEEVSDAGRCGRGSGGGAALGMSRSPRCRRRRCP